MRLASAVAAFAPRSLTGEVFDAEALEALAEGRSLTSSLEGQPPHGYERNHPCRRV